MEENPELRAGLLGNVMSRPGFEQRVLKWLAPIAGLLALACGREPDSSLAGGPVRTESARLLSDGLVAAYAFDEDTGTTSADATGAGQTASLAGQSWTYGKFGSALEFDQNIVTVADSELLDLTDGMTLSAWVLPMSGEPDWRAVLVREDEEAEQFSYVLLSDRADMRPALYVAGTESWGEVGGVATIPVGRWSHLASSYDGENLRLYVNAELTGSVAFDQVFDQLDGPLLFGGNHIWGQFFKGRIDEVRIHDRALSQSEIAEAMATPITPGATPEATPPAVSITSPAPGATVSGLVTLEADASDANGIAKVEFLVDGQPIPGELASAPYERSWLASAASAGAHELRARATDLAGNQTLSAPVTVNVPAETSRLGLVAAWSFDEGTGTEVHDATGAGHDTELAGQSWVTGKYGSALEFNENYLIVQSSEFIELGDRMTLSAWVLPYRELEANELVLQKFADWQESYHLRPGSWWAGGVGFRSSPWEWFEAQTHDAEAKPGAWTHVAGSYDGSLLRFYLNGEVVAETEASGAIYNGVNPLLIGGNDEPDSWFPGRIDEVRIYDRALTAGEIQMDMATPIMAGALPDTTPPAVSMTAPAEGSSLSGLVALTATASDPSGIRSVRFIVDGVPFGSALNEPPYSKNWHANSAAAGTHTLAVEATDVAGNTNLSEPVSVTVAEEVSTPGLVLALGFDEGTGVDTHDGSGAGHDATLAGQNWAAGKFGTALEFDGELLEVVDSDLLDLPGELTLSAWVLPRPGNAHQAPILIKQDYWDFSYAFFAGHESEGGELLLLGDEWGWVTSQTPTPASTWTHLAATSDGSDLRFYLNGELTATNGFSSGILNDVDGPLHVGGDITREDGIFLGRIDELRVYDRALSAGEIQSDMLTPVTQGATSETTPPSVALLAPLNGASVSGLVTLEAAASDANGVERVEFLVDGESIGSVAGEPYVRSWLAGSATAGTHELRVKATDHAGNEALSDSVIVTVSESGSHFGLVAAYAFDEGGGNETFDATGAGHDATLTGQNWVAGRYGSALQFGENYLSVQSSEFIQLESELTLSAWALPETELDQDWPLILQKFSDWRESYFLRAAADWWGSGVGIYSSEGEWFSADGTGDVEADPGHWTHVAGTYDGSLLRLYLNGELVSEREASGALRTGDSPLTIGGNEDPQTLFPGRLDEIRIYDRALSASEIQADMATPITPGAVPDTTPPLVVLAEPGGGDASGLVTLRAEASDASGVRHVRFFVDGEPVGQPVSSPPYTRNWHANSASPGEHELQAEATDAMGNFALSQPTIVTVGELDARPGLVLALGFDEGEGTIARDGTGAGHDAVLSGQTWAGGKFGSSLEFGGNLLEVSESDYLDLTTMGTISAWILPRADDSPDAVVAIKQQGWDFSFGLIAGNWDGRPELALLGDQWGWVSGDMPTPAGRWSHLAATFNGEELELYVDGELAGTGEYAGGILNQVDGPFHVGGDITREEGRFLGRIDELRLYRRALSQAEIQMDMALPITPGAATDTTPPIVTLTSPAAGSVASGLVGMTADAADSSGIQSVTFLLDGVAIGGRDTDAPYAKQWHAGSAAPGAHVLQAQAIDGSGNVGLSPGVPVSVAEGTGIYGLIAAYGFDEAEGEDVHDATGGGHDTTLAGQSWVRGKFGHALEFSGNFLTVDSSERLELTDAMTISAWVMPSRSFEGPALIAEKWATDWQESYVFLAGTESDRSVVGFQSDTFEWFVLDSEPGAPPPGSWTHVTTTYDGSRLKLYLDGDLVGARDASGSILTGPLPLFIGGNDRGDGLFPGRIDELRIYDRALSESEIAAAMATPITEGAESDTTPPVVSLVEPAPNSTVSGFVTLSADASDESGVRGVRFLVDGVPLAEDTEAPYATQWFASAATTGVHQLRAEATDSAGNVQLSSPIDVVIEAGTSVPGLVLALGFDEGSGEETIDASGAGHDAELSGQNWARGRFGSALEFDGERLTVADSDLLDLTSALTISAWVMPKAPIAEWSTILAKQSDWEFSYLLYAPGPGDRIEARLACDEWSSVSADRALPPNRWTHVALTFQGSEAVLYQDGEVVGTSQVEGTSLHPVAGPLFIGGSTLWSEQNFRGLIDEVRIYNRKLSQVELQTAMSTPITDGAAADTSPPAVSLLEPSNGESVDGFVELLASVTDAGGIGSVEFLVDGAVVGAPLLAPPFSRFWNTTLVPPGNHELRARATDYSGNVALGPAVTVNVGTSTSASMLVAAFGFDEGERDVVFDASGRGHDSTLSGQSWAQGKYGSALAFDGSYLSVEDSDFLDLSTGMTLSAWVMPTEPLVHYPTILMKETEHDQVYVLYASSPEGPASSYFMSPEGLIDVSGGVTPPVGEWTYLAATYDGAALRLYVNGDLAGQTETNVPIIQTDKPLRIGGNQIWSEEFFQGRIDEVRVYARALSEAELEMDMARPVDAPSGPDTTPPVVAIAAPAAGASVYGSVLLRAEATDAGGIASVRFFVDGAPFGSPVTAAPYEIVWPTLGSTLGAHTLAAEATDAAGNTATSSAISVTVTTPPVCDPALVSDGNPCTADSCDGNAAVFTPVGAGTSCSNGNRCDGEEVCNGSGVCQVGTPPSVDATCDGIDDDCNGQLDEDYVGAPTSCGTGACARNATMVCQNGSVVDGCTPGTPAANDATCNDLDDDCNGQKDEDYTPITTSCGAGACAATGVTSCLNGAVANHCTPGTPAGSDASCNNVDDDCNGQKDEDYAPVATSCGTGACAATGVTSCVNGSLGNSCAPGSPAGADTTCDGFDDDCDGQTDEDFVSVATSCGVGACSTTGATSCVNGTLGNSCSPGTPAATDATCNNIDDDCNGQKDEDFVSTPTTCGTSACAATGATSCESGAVVDSCSPSSPAGQDTTCDGIDNDCDGQIDEGYVPVPTTCGVGACASSGTTSCVNGSVQDSCTAGVAASSDATCNGIDDDCSGQTDEDFAQAATSCGTGACAATGVSSCIAGSVQNSCTPGTAAANDATCNGIDDDCSGQADEDFAPAATSCGTGACAAAGVTSCVGGSVQNSCTPGTPAANDASCNGIDDDCSGQTDEDFAPATTSCGTGACAAAGVTSCVGGALQNSCTPGSPAANDATCDGFDDDCNGQTDEDYVSLATTCGTSACTATGATSCENGTVVDSCEPGTPAAGDTTCDGIDNDCDGSVDEGFVPAATNCGVGACAATGVTSCVGGAVQNSCSPGTPAASDASCNGIDDDCSGQSDEDFAPATTSCGTGACAATGVTSCAGGAVQNSCTPGTPAASDTTCNGIDDDCSGQADEDYAPSATSCGTGACVATGVTSCVSGSVQNSCTPGTPAASDASCNGIDDDCSGQVDEDYAAAATACGAGACASTGTTSCVNGSVQNSCTPGSPAASDASCNGIDDDCDGSVDENYISESTTCGASACTATGATSCVNGSIVDSCEPGTPAANDTTCDGIDNDCDGQTDEGYVPVATSCGTGACAATGITSCVSGSLQNSCAPGTPAANDASCNGVDDDCNGQADEDYAPVATSCGTGACAATGATSCVNGSVQNGCTPSTPAVNDATCDAIDDDCNGTADEDYAPLPTTCGAGVCTSTGVTSCLDGSVTDSCTPGSPGADDTTCDGIDNDCDGQKDEGYVSVTTQCGVGACASSGATSCVNGSVQNSCAPGTPAASDASCNGIDDDCSGQNDEDYAATSTSCGVGACASTGATSCVNGSVQNSCAPGTPAANDASCNGIDDDCSGQPDEDYVDVPTACGAGICAATGTARCAGGAVQNDCTPGSPASSTDTSCDGLDQDCDGAVDDDYPFTNTSCGVGACARSGVRTCSSGSVVDSCSPGTAAASDTTCDGADDDCDGETDESYVPGCSGTQARRCQSGQIVTTECSDANVCSGTETCTGQGACQSGTPLATDDVNPCTSDSCDPVSGVSHIPVSSGVACGPGRICDGQGTCVLEFSPPVIETQPAAASVSTGASFAFTVVATGVNLTYQWQRFGANIPGATSPTYSGVAEYSDNGGVYRVVISNPGGTVTSGDATLTVVDLTPPTLSLDGPSEVATALDTVALRGSATDPGSGMDRVFVTSDRYAGQTFGVALGGAGTFQGDIPLRGGANLLTVVALDRAGNRAEAPLTATLLVGAVPSVRISVPTSGSVVATDTVTVSGTVTSSLPAEEIRLRLGTTVIFPEGTNGEYTFSFEGVRLTPGQNTLSVSAETAHGNGSAQTVVTLQSGTGGGPSEPPAIYVADVQPDMFVSSALLPINGTVRAQTCVQSVTVNGAAAVVTGSGTNVSFSSFVNITQIDGAPFEINVVARDCAAQEALLRFFVRYDGVRPSLAVQGLSPEPAVNAFIETPVRIRGVLTERNPAGLSVGNQSVGVVPGGTPDTWNFEFDAPLVRGQSSLLTIETWDRAGHRDQASFVLRLDSTVDIQILSPSAGTEFLGGQGAVSIDVLARVPGIAPSDVVVCRVDAGAPVTLARSGDLARGTLTTADAPAERTLTFDVRSAGGELLATRATRIKIVDPSSVPLALRQHFPGNAASNIEANEPIVLEFTRAVTPELLEVSVLETVHSRAFDQPQNGADITTLSDVKQIEVNRDQSPVPGGLSFLPGNRNVAFYPRRDYGYGGNVLVAVRHDGAELGRFGFTVRPLPTLVYGFVADTNMKPLEAVEVRLKELGLSTLTDERGYYSFGFGRMEDAIPGGRYRLEVNPGWRNRNISQSETWISAQDGQLTSLGLRRVPNLPDSLPTAEIRSGAEARLGGGEFRVDLSSAAATFADGRATGEGMTLFLGPNQLPYAAVPHAIPLFGYLVAPAGIRLSGSVGVTAKLPTRDGSYDYLADLPDWVLIVGLDANALELVPVGVGRIDRVRYVIESEGELALGRLDFVGFRFAAEPQQALEAYASRGISLTQLNSQLAGGQP
jgi:hypothetical protein